MYKKPETTPELPDFALPFEGCLNPENRWIKLARRLPWHELKADYTKHFKHCGRGEIALNVRIALGALLIKEMLGLSDRGVMEAVTENPYLQYFLGFKTFQNQAPFDASLMTHFRKRLPAEEINRFNEKVITKVTEQPDPEDDPPPGGGNPVPDSEKPKNAGTIMMDAACAPADIKYPTDLNLVNDARKRTEKLIDQLRERVPESGPRSRSRPQICRRRFLDAVKH